MNHAIVTSKDYANSKDVINGDSNVMQDLHYVFYVKFKTEFKRKIIMFYYSEMYRYIYINGSISRSYNRATDPIDMLQIL